MCTPAVIPVTLMGLSAVGTGLGMMGNAQASKAQAQASLAQTQATMQNYAAEINSANTRYAQEQEKAQQEQQQIYIQNLQSKAAAQASAAGNNISGISIDNLFNGYDRASSVSNFITERNLRNLGLQYNENLAGMRAKAMSSINSQNLDNNLGMKQASTLLSGVGGILSASGSYKGFWGGS